MDEIMVRDDHGNIGEVVGGNGDGTVLVQLLGEDEPRSYTLDELTAVEKP